ncbi:hypothetical protein DMENIID0001_013000 [Sergentomyia squamirostris]
MRCRLVVLDVYARRRVYQEINKVCIVKGCNKKGYLVYPFPRDKHRETQWLTSFMPKDGFTMDAKYGVCSVHFRDGDFYANSMRLKCNAVPSLELIDPQIELRSSENREETLESEVNVQQEPIEEICENVSGPYDTIPNFNSLVSNYKIHLKEDLLAKFFIEKNDNFLSFCKLHFESTGQVSVQNSVTISTNLMVTVYLEGKQVEQQQEDPVNLPCNNKLRNFSQLKDILEGLLETRSYGLLTSSTFRNSLTLSVYAIEEILNERQMPLDEETEDIVHHISVVRDQLKQIQDNTNEFSEDTVAICWKINNTSSKAYEYLRELLFLPDPEQLKKFVEPDSSLADESQMEICDMDEEFSVPEEKVNSYADVFVKDLDEIDEM